MSAFQRPSSPDPFADEERPSGRSLEGSLTITTDPLQVPAHQPETGHEAVGQTLQKIHGDGAEGVFVWGEVLRATKGKRMKKGRSININQYQSNQSISFSHVFVCQVF